MTKQNNTQVVRAKHVLDAKGMILGRLATQVATLLRGKHKPSFELHEDQGDFVTIINAAAIKVTGNKLEDKLYHRHSGYIGSLKTINLGDLLEKSPEQVIEHAVKGMLPKNRLQAKWMQRLKVYAGEQE
jgi:large subunit ribosomal protein L13